MPLETILFGFMLIIAGVAIITFVPMFFWVGVLAILVGIILIMIGILTLANKIMSCIHNS